MRDDPFAAVGETKEDEKSQPISPAESSSPDPEKAQEELVLNQPDHPTGIFPIPIRNDRVVYLQNMPLDLSHKEAQKIVAVVQALVDPDA